MIKNILKSKLFVLCSMLFCSLVVSVFCFGISSSAAGQTDIDNLRNGLYSHLNFTITESSASQIIDYWSSNNYTYLWFWKRSDGYVRAYVANGYTRPSDYYPTQPCYQSSDIYPGTTSTITWSSYNSYINSNSSWGWFVGSWSDFHTPDINWNTPLYSANIVAPYVNITYRDFTSVPTYDVPLNVDIGSNGDLYIEAFALFDIPTQVFASYGRNGYEYNTLEKYTIYKDLVTPQSLKVSSDFSLDSFHLLMNDAWYDAASLIPDQDIIFAYPDGMTQHLKDTATNRYYNLRKNQCMVGNNVYLYFRYFTVINSDFVVGPWRVWSSYDPGSYTDQVPSYIQPYLPAVGTSGTNTEVIPVNTSSPEPSQIYNPSSTGQNISIEVKQNVPNYPDYPTVASYNKDNLLVDLMNQLTSIEGFFGEFGSFLVTAFAFMPAWIWAIIGVGFSLSIVIMFLKIL